jgi:hypothetical protein
MDTSEKYVKMCEKAIDIQNKWSPNPGDYVCWRNDLSIGFIVNYFCCDWEFRSLLNGQHWSCSNNNLSNATFWIPRQDQLQSLLEGHYSNILFRLNVFAQSPSINNTTYDSIEQLTLSLVMIESYGKIWIDNEEWISWYIKENYPRFF